MSTRALLRLGFESPGPRAAVYAQDDVTSPRATRSGRARRASPAPASRKSRTPARRARRTPTQGSSASSAKKSKRSDDNDTAKASSGKRGRAPRVGLSAKGKASKGGSRGGSGAGPIVGYWTVEAVQGRLLAGAILGGVLSAVLLTRAHWDEAWQAIKALPLLGALVGCLDDDDCWCTRLLNSVTVGDISLGLVIVFGALYLGLATYRSVRSGADPVLRHFDLGPTTKWSSYPVPRALRGEFIVLIGAAAGAAALLSADFLLAGPSSIEGLVGFAVLSTTATLLSMALLEAGLMEDRHPFQNLFFLEGFTFSCAAWGCALSLALFFSQRLELNVLTPLATDVLAQLRW